MTDMAAPADLHAPLELPCGVVLPNRVAKAAMSEQLADRQGRPLPALVALYQRWAASGAGLLITGNVAVQPSQLVEPYNVVVTADDDPTWLAEWVDAAKCHGARLFMQLNHPGRQALRAVTGRSLAPSAVSPRQRLLRWALARPIEMTVADIGRIVEAFAASAAVAERAGFDGVEVHAAHGYLLSQFLSPLTNHRRDGWGGSIERRSRILMEVVRAIRGRVGRRFAVTVKLNASDFEDGGFSVDDAVCVAAALEPEGIDLLEVSGGSGSYWLHLLGAATPTAGYFTTSVEHIRHAVDVPVMLTGGLRDGTVVRELVARGVVDVIGLARPFAVDPNAARRLLAGGTLDNLPTPRRSAVRAVGAALSSPWHQQQLRRLGRGLDPQPSRGRAGTAARLVEMQLRWRTGRNPAL
ncbi:NADH oxidase [Mycobacterium simulans]|uniref:oxidoreductase n=1 Tax=Mycobacterium simulans TaxID=627089 RepID=UPI00174A7247|nr:NADH:flavin oxidoreductase [Mycobacterium simulans]SON58635.1 NADH oxidase [Mycobacterium simulans]